MELSPNAAEIPLSFNQDVQILGEWLASLRSELPPRLHPHCAYYWEGALDVGALQQATDALIARHEALRTAFPDPAAVSPSIALQISRRLSAHDLLAASLFKGSVWATATSRLRVHDELMGRSVEHPAVMAALHRAVEEPRSYSTPPNLRASLFRLTPTSGVLLLGFHPLVTDNWSVRLIQRDLATLYRRCCGDEGAVLPPLPMQYSDFSASQRRQIVAGELDGAIAYWGDQWRDFFPSRITVDDLPLSRPQQATASVAAPAEAVTIEGPAYAAIRAFVRRAAATSYTFWVAALSILFHLYSGKEKIAFFSNTAGRTLTNTENVIGWFANSSLIGVRVSPHHSPLAVLRHVRDTALQAQEREAVPLGALWAMFLKEGRFQELTRGDWIAMNFGEHRRIRVEHWGIDGLSMRPLDLGISAPTGTAVNIGIMNRGDRFVVSCTYHPDRVAAADVKELLADLRRVGEELATGADGAIGAFGREMRARTGEHR